MSYHDFDAYYVLMRNNSVKSLPYILGHTIRGQRFVYGYPSALLLI
jgi:hypothetical protein